ncbi:MAG TPA: hypothetical protein VMT30_01065 [Candidatus Saccharimonadia bacterium]|nr:hypothetical protein [Candidatus Saccharimonadia bacterium]
MTRKKVAAAGIGLSVLAAAAALAVRRYRSGGAEELTDGDLDQLAELTRRFNAASRGSTAPEVEELRRVLAKLQRDAGISTRGLSVRLSRLRRRQADLPDDTLVYAEDLLERIELQASRGR